MIYKIMVLSSALMLSAGVTLADEVSGQAGQQTGGTVGLSAGSEADSTAKIDLDKDGKISLTELDDNFRQLNLEGQDAVFAGLTDEQIQALREECKSERIPPDQFKDTCDRLGKLNM
jgi:hypothetical protein